MHQHGYAHVNHEPEGRKCEFGVSRSAAEQADDIAAGRELLGSQLGDLAPVFTPPWNRCAPWTAEVLRDLGVAVLSRDLSAGVAGVPGLVELPVTVDWFAKRRKVPVDRTGRGELLAEKAREPRPVGVMLHHEVMSDLDRADTGALLALLGRASRRRRRPPRRAGARRRLTRCGVPAQSRTTCGAWCPAVRLRVSKTFWLCRTICSGS